MEEESDSMLESNYEPVQTLDKEDPFSFSAIVRKSNYVPVQRKLDEDCVPVQYEEECECKSEPDSTFASVPKSVSNSTSASSGLTENGGPEKGGPMKNNRCENNDRKMQD